MRFFSVLSSILIGIVNLFLIFSSNQTLAQSPQKFNYQAVVRDKDYQLLINRFVSIQVSICRNFESTAPVYAEIQKTFINSNGLITVEVGAGMVIYGSLSSINWSEGPYFIKTDVDPEGGSDFSINGVTEMLSVPYALYAETSGSNLPGIKGDKGDVGEIGLQGPSGVKGELGNMGEKGLIGEKGQMGEKGVQGNMGEKGIQGEKGDSGDSGPQGIKGESGDVGELGLKGAIGDTGEVGLIGDQGQIGDQGEMGPAGEKGEIGEMGEVGLTGLTGLKGGKGETGNSGLNGDKGDLGNQGSIGLIGSQGSKGFVGEQGIKGIEGDLGAQGTMGLTGPQGSKGLKGDIGNQGLVGLTGAQGTKGLKGDMGSQGVMGATGLQGPKGEKGEMGDLGQLGITGGQGIKGDKGDTGAQGQIGAVGLPGIKGDVGAMGEQGVSGLMGVKGEKGQQGDMGIQGNVGLKGLQGEKGDIGNAGPQGLVGLTGINGEKGDVGSLGIQGPTGPIGPKGEKGDLGSTGVQGITGLTGPKGEKGETGDAGIKGALGLTGPVGEKGNSGDQGLQGIPGINGGNGINGMPGKNMLMKTTDEPSGLNCPTGGIKIETGIDLNGNNFLDSIEINQNVIKYVCGGATGLTGQQGLKGNSFPNGTSKNQILYWNGTSWVVLNPGVNGKSLTICNGELIWAQGGICPGVYSSGTINCNPVSTAIVDVVSPGTGKIWMDRNLGASQAATSSIDNKAYGDLYQWGRAADGHQCRSSYTTSALSSTDKPNHSYFITGSSATNDWRTTSNSNLWQGEAGVNNPCPSGYRLPTKLELSNELNNWSPKNSSGAINSPLKFTLAGSRNSGSFSGTGTIGYYWSSTSDGAYSFFLKFDISNAEFLSTGRLNGYSVRCIKN